MRRVDARPAAAIGPVFSQPPGCGRHLPACPPHITASQPARPLARPPHSNVLQQGRLQQQGRVVDRPDWRCRPGSGSGRVRLTCASAACRGVSAGAQRTFWVSCYRAVAVAKAASKAAAAGGHAWPRPGELERRRDGYPGREGVCRQSAHQRRAPRRRLLVAQRRVQLLQAGGDGSAPPVANHAPIHLPHRYLQCVAQAGRAWLCGSLSSRSRLCAA